MKPGRFPFGTVGARHPIHVVMTIFSPPTNSGPQPRILLTADTVGGVWTFACDLVEAIAQAGGSTLLAAIGPTLSRSQARTARDLPHCEFHHRAARLEWMADPWADVKASGEWLRTLADQWPPDIVHCNGYAEAALGWEVPVVLTAHSCVFSWYQAVKGAPPTDEGDAYFRVVRAGLAAADCVVSPTSAMHEALACYGQAGDDWHVVPNGRPAERFKARRRRRQCFLSVGRVEDEGKGFPLLASASPRLP